MTCITKPSIVRYSFEVEPNIFKVLKVIKRFVCAMRCRKLIRHKSGTKISYF